MHFRYKLIYSLLVIVAAIGGYLYEEGVGLVGPKFAVLALAFVMLIAVWIFPVVNRSDVQESKVG
ncbi:hypothetical protein H0A70_19340 [Alcaligenaceae bacterium]|nr:hypothetical protein [Alcaligenaceae bacterium]